MDKTAPLREYWILKVREPESRGMVGPVWLRQDGSFTARRDCAERYGTRGAARDVRTLLLDLKRVQSTIVHVRVYPKGRIVAWERVVRAADRLERSWGVKLTRGEAQRAMTGLFAAVRALGPHRPEGA